MTHFDKRTEQFVDEGREFGIEREEDLGDFDQDGNAMHGVAVGCTLGVLLWIVIFSLWLYPWTRVPVASVTVVFVILIVIYAANGIVDDWRRAHPDNPIVEALRRSGL